MSVHTEENIQEYWVTFDADRSSTVLAASTVEVFLGITYRPLTRTIECLFIDEMDRHSWEEFSI